MLKNILSYKAIFLGPLLSCHFLYINYSCNKKELIVKDKYTYVKAGFTHFMIIDHNNIHYNIHNSFWYGKWDSVEDWTNIKIGEHLRVKYYGYRFPLFGMFPNIVDTKHDEDSDKIKATEILKNIENQLVNSTAVLRHK